jgi:hypothetical protein
MRPFSASDIVRLWEEGQAQHALDRALTLLSAAWPELTRAQLAALDVGARDARLLRLREWTVGPVLECYAECPACRTQLEFQVTTSALLSTVTEEPRRQELEVAGIMVHYRLPDSHDLAAAVRCADTDEARRMLVRRCVLKATEGELLLSADALPEGVLTALCERMEVEASAADVRMSLECPSCRHGWQGAIDIVEFFWKELSAEARRLLREVHLLARAYCWSEESILAMRPQRRQYYLELVGA